MIELNAAAQSELAAALLSASPGLRAWTVRARGLGRPQRELRSKSRCG